METEPYKLCYKKMRHTIYVGDGFHPVPKTSFFYSPFYFSKNAGQTLTFVIILICYIPFKIGIVYIFLQHVQNYVKNVALHHSVA